MKIIDGDLCHKTLMNNIHQKLAFNNNVNLQEWKNLLYEKFCQLIGVDNIKNNIAQENFEIEYTKEYDTYKLIRFTFESEIDSIVPCFLVVPKQLNKKLPLVITLQGHSSGFHNSVGIIKFEGDNDYQPRGCFALQAVERGYVALAIEQRAMGERKPKYTDFTCGFAAQNAILLGRTLIGERVWDVSKAIDIIERKFDFCDMNKIIITGNSGGGTAAFYSACYDKRIKICVPSCAFCSYKSSIMSILHCSCNFIPNAYNYFEMSDLAGLIAPRYLTIVAGAKDDIFPISGVKDAYYHVSQIYDKFNCRDNCKLYITDKGHWWCQSIVFDAIEEQINKLVVEV